MVARFGGDEFVLLLLNLSDDMTTAAAQAETIGKKILSAMRMPLQLDTVHYRCSGSIGLTLFGNKPVSVEELLKQADIAMYRVKERGRGNFSFYQPQMSAGLLSRMKLEHAMRQALGLGHMAVHYQPQVDMATGRIVGAEALARWTGGCSFYWRLTVSLPLTKKLC